MSHNPIIVIIFTGVISLISFETIVYWHRATKGTWRDWPAGRSLMALLGIIALGFGYGIINQIFGQYPGRGVISFILYLLFIGAQITIRATIAAELRRGKTEKPDATVDLTVASTKETPHE